MKSRFTKIAAAALALTMCVPSAAFATGSTAPAINGEKEGSFNTSFDVYSPALHISVPLKADIQVNPMANASATGVGQFTVASNSIDIINASVDTEADAAIPVNVTVKAAISSKKDDVVTEYNTFTVDPTSTKKKIHLNLTAASTAATLDTTSRVADGANAKLLDLSKVSVSGAAVYTSPTNTTAITKYGSLLSVDIAAPTADSGTSYIDPTKLLPAVGSFAVTGVANTNADWKADDVAVAITYNVKASQPLSIKTPVITSAPSFTNNASATDLSIVVPGVKEATVVAMAVHNDGEGLYGDFLFENDAYTVTYASNDATIKIPKDNGTLSFLAGADYSGKAQDLIIALSDGRYVVSTLTVTAAATP